MDRCRCARATPDATDATDAAAATNEGVKNGECNGKVNNGVNDVSATAAGSVQKNHNGNDASEQLELLSSSKGACVSVIGSGGGDDSPGNKTGSMV